MPRVSHHHIFGVSHSAKPKALSEFGWRLMQAEQRKATLGNLRLICVLAAIMVPVFVVLDYFAYPEHVRLFLGLRLLCTTFILGLLVLLESGLGKRFYRTFTVALPLIPAFFISVMIYFSRDPGTPYYAGLTLCIVAIGFLFHWTYQEAFVVSASVLSMYLVACSPAIISGMDSKTAAGFINNCIFLSAKGVVVVSGSLAHHGFLVREFMVRDRLRQQKISLRARTEELTRTLRELEKTEDELIQSEKMASLGQLSAGVIHEIGNPLNYSNQALFLLRKRLRDYPDDVAVQEALDDTQESIDRIKEIVRELRDFSHKSSEVRIDYPIEESIQVALRMLGKEIENSDTAVSVDIDPELRVEGVKNQVSQVFINLVHNSLQAMEKGSSLEPNRIDISAWREEGLVKVGVRDNGPGICQDTVAHIFDPFFTTKEVGEGTGLGLSICYRIVEAHNGAIKVDSELGCYTQFTVAFPAPETAPEAESDAEDSINPTTTTTHGTAVC